ncbi:MAG: serpin family protein, partial [Planctomycetia bacterium]
VRVGRGLRLRGLRPRGLRGLCALVRGLLAGALGAPAGPRAAAAGEPPALPAPPPAAAQDLKAQLLAGQQAFALELYARLPGDGRSNVVLSPHSVHQALALARVGARGETAAQLDRVLHLPGADLEAAWREPGSAAGEAARALLAAWQRLGQRLGSAPAVRDPVREGGTQPAYTLSVANALWGQDGYPFVPGCLDALELSFGTPLHVVDFRAGPAVREAINGWVAQRTRDKIKDLVPEGLPTPDTRLVLVNAIHLLAAWSEAFPEGATRPAPFRLAAGGEVEVPMMRRQGRLRCFEEGDARVAVLPCQGGAVELWLVLPRDPSPAALPAVEQALTPGRLAAWAARPERRQVDLALPRLRVEQALELSAVLRALGLADAFDPARADFGALAAPGGEPLFVGSVLHKAYVAMDERGLEAAAATAVMMRTTGMPGEPPVAFACDRPFLWLARHAATGAVLFMGRVARPQG